MKKILVIALLAMMIVGLAGCASIFKDDANAEGSLPELKDDVNSNPDPGQLDNVPIDTTDVFP